MSATEVARLLIPALRLDRWSEEEVAARAGEALDLGVGGFVLFGGEAGAVGRLTASLRRSAGRPLLFGADLERGAGQQFRGLTELPPPAALAAHPDPEWAAERAGRVTAREARSVGVDWILAPVLDLDVERANPIVATRSFGSDPRTVARLANGWIEGCQAEGAAACAKHFPGHGRTLEDSHMGLPVVDAPARALEDDLAPFAAVAGRVRSVMVAHVAFPALGSDGPATLSPAIVADLLRGRLGHDGLVATDAMIMDAIGPDDAQAAVGAVRAGCDLVLYPRDMAGTAAALERAWGEDEAWRDRAEAALRRSAALVGALDGSAARAADVGSEAGGFDAVGFAADTVAGRPGDLGGWSPAAPTDVVGVSDDPEVGPPAGRAGPLGRPLAEELADRGWNVREGAGAEAEQRVVVVAATPRGWKGRSGPSVEVLEDVRAALAGARRGLVVLLGHPRWLEELGAPGFCAWSTETVMERAAARALHAAVAGASEGGG